MNKKMVIAAGVLLLLVVAVIGGSFYKKYSSVLDATSEGLYRGEKFGKVIEQGKCIVGLKLVYPACDTVECELSVNGFIDGCMRTARKDDFCSSVPGITETKKSLEWVADSCQQYDLGEDKCLKYMHRFVSACTEQRENRTISKSEIFEAGFEKAQEQNGK